jgi:hypothetical protein
MADYRAQHEARDVVPRVREPRPTKWLGGKFKLLPHSTPPAAAATCQLLLFLPTERAHIRSHRIASHPPHRSGRGEVRRMTARGRSLFVFLSEPPPCRVSSTTFHGGGGRDLGRVRGGYRARGGQYQLGEVRAKQNSTNLDGGY